MPQTNKLACAAALSTELDLDAAVADVADSIEAQLDGQRPDLTFLFATHHYGGDLARTGAEMVAATGTEALAGCTAAWTACNGREAENGPGLVALAACLGDTHVRIDHVSRLPGPGAPLSTLEFEEPEEASVLMVADPFTFPTADWLGRFHRAHGGVPIAGGLASGGLAPGQNLLFAGSDPVSSGAIAIVLEGQTRVVTAVSQGCRPVGPPLVATKVDGHVVLEFRGQPAAKVMFEVIESLDEADRALFQQGAFVGRAVDPTKTRFESGDLLVRNIMGLDPERHALAVADPELRAGATLQLMVRDADSARAELASVLEVAGLEASGAAFGGLLFTCGGRGQGMFGSADHDASAIERAFGPGFPLAGFSAGGEIGQVSGRPYLHGFTASAAFLAPRD